MDPLTISSTTVGVLKLSYSVSTTLYSFISAATEVNENIRSLHSEVQSLGVAVSAVESLVKKSSTTRSSSLDLWSDISTILETCVITLKRFKDQLDGIPSPPTSRKTALLRNVFRQYKLNLRIEDVDRLRAQLQTHNQALKILLEALTVDILTATLDPASSTDELSAKLDSLMKSLQSFSISPQLKADTNNSYIVSATESLRNNAKAVASNASEILGSRTTVREGAKRGSELGVSLNGENRRRIEEWNETASTILEEVDSDDELESEIIINYISLGKKNFQKKEYGEAERFFRRANDSVRVRKSRGIKTVGYDPRALEMLIAEACLYQDKLEEAKAMYEGLRRDLTTSEEHQAQALQISLNLSKAYLRCGELPSASHQCRRTVHGLRKLEGKTARYYEAVSLMVGIMDAQGDADQSAAWSMLLDDGDVVPTLSDPPSWRTSDALTSTPSESDIKNPEARFSETCTEFEDVFNTNGPQQALFWAARYGTLNEVEVAIYRGADIEGVDSRGGGALHEACSSKNEKNTEVLLLMGANVNALANGQTPLQIACATNEESLVLLLIRYDARIEDKGDGVFTPLFDSVRNENIKMVGLLLDNGANIMVDSPEGTVFHVATRLKSVTMLRFLVSRGANINMTSIAVSFNPTAIMLAAILKDYNMVLEILKLGGDPNITAYDGRGIFHALAFEANESLQLLDTTVRALVEGGGDLNKPTKYGTTPLDLAIFNHNSEVAAIFRKYGAANR